MLQVLLDLADIEARHYTRPGAFAQIQRRPERYDPHILAAARLCLVEAEAAILELASVGVPLKSLVSGHVLAADIHTCDGKVLLTAGWRMTDVLLEKLRNYAAVVSIQEPICVQLAQ